MAVNNTQGIVLAIFGANAGGHLSSLEANATANGNASLATDLSAAAGLILGVDLSSDAAFTSTVLGNLGIVDGTDGYTLASNYFTTNLAAGAGRGDLVATAVEYLLGSNVDASLTASAAAFSTRVTEGVAYSQGEGASVFGVAQLQTAAGSAATAGEGSSFELTDANDTLNGTAGNDTFTGTTTNLSADDRLIDTSVADNDVFNLTATADPAAMDVTSVETINIDWQGFGTPDIDLDNVSGATVVLSSSKVGYLGNANFDNVSENNVSTGAGVTGTVTVDGAENMTVTSTVADTIDIGTGTAADGLITVNAGAAETVNITGADDVVLVAPSAEAITIDTAFDTADLTLGASGDLTLQGATDATVVIRGETAETNIDLDVQASMTLETITLEGDATIDLDFADDADLSGLDLNNGGAVRVASAPAAAMDIDKVEADLITWETAIAADSTFTGLDGHNYLFEADNGANTLGLVLTTTNDGDADEITLTFEVTQASTFDGAVATNTDFETMNIIADGADDITLGGVDAGTGTVTLQSPTNDLTITNLTAGSVDASTVSTDLVVTQTAAADMAVEVGDADTTFTFKGTSHENSIVLGDGDSTIIFATNTGTAAVVAGDGEVTATAGSLNSGGFTFIGGNGDNAITVDSLTSGSVVITTGDGDNQVDMAPGTLAGAEVSIVFGSGDDEVEFDLGATVTIDADTEIVMNFGTGTDTLDFSAIGGAYTADLTGGTFTAEGLDVIALGANATLVNFDGAFLSGETYTITGAGTVAEQLVVTHDKAGTYDYSGLQLDGTISKATGGLNISGHSGNDIITGTSSGDTIDTGNGVNTVTAGAGADAVTLGSGVDTIVLGTNSQINTTSYAAANTDNTNLDDYNSVDFGSEDVIQLSVANGAYGDGVNFSADTTVNYVHAGSFTADTFADVYASINDAVSETKSTSSVVYIYTATITAGGDVAADNYLVINDGTATVNVDDTMIALSGVTNLDATDFTFG